MFMILVQFLLIVQFNHSFLLFFIFFWANNSFFISFRFRIVVIIFAIILRFALFTIWIVTFFRCRCYFPATPGLTLFSRSTTGRLFFCFLWPIWWLYNYFLRFLLSRFTGTIRPGFVTFGFLIFIIIRLIVLWVFWITGINSRRRAIITQLWSSTTTLVRIFLTFHIDRPF